MARPLELNPDRALIFRITHRSNVPWILANGIHCAASTVRDPNFVSIGNSDLITKRTYRTMPPPLGGTLANYVPFYFTPFSPMMLNIFTGYGGITKQAKRDIVILVSSIHKVLAEGLLYVFADRHAYLHTARFSSDPADLAAWIPWTQLQARDFRRDPNDPAKLERYQAEALVRGVVPVTALNGVVCFDDVVTNAIAAMVAQSGKPVQVVTRPGWYH